MLEALLRDVAHFQAGASTPPPSKETLSLAAKHPTASGGHPTASGGQAVSAARSALSLYLYPARDANRGLLPARR